MKRFKYFRGSALIVLLSWDVAMGLTMSEEASQLFFRKSIQVKNAQDWNVFLDSRDQLSLKIYLCRTELEKEKKELPYMCFQAAALFFQMYGVYPKMSKLWRWSCEAEQLELASLDQIQKLVGVVSQQDACFPFVKKALSVKLYEKSDTGLNL